jgi:putative phosphoribosyl transferase
MRTDDQSNVFELPELRNRLHVFADRPKAGAVLAQMLGAYRNGAALVLAVPAGGIPVGAAMARELRLPLDVAVVSKVTLPWNTEAGYGAVAFDGTVRLNEALLPRLGLSAEDVSDGIARTREKVRRRVESLRGDRPLPELSGRPVVLVDDGLASGFTMQVAVEVVRKAGAEEVILAVPTGHADAVRRLSRMVDVLYCANIRGGRTFAVADAYKHWYDLTDEEIERILTDFRSSSSEGG